MASELALLSLFCFCGGPDDELAASFFSSETASSSRFFTPFPLPPARAFEAETASHGSNCRKS